MDLLERYLAAVARDLPERQRADVIAELRDSLLSMIEDAEARAGRPQTPGELESMLAGFGHPLQVAGRYRRVQHLIGPEIFPFWWAGLRASLAIVAAVYILLVCIEAFTTGNVSRALHGVDTSLIGVLITTFGAVTLVGAAVERWGKPRLLLARWTPRDLPPVGGKAKSTFERALDLGSHLVFLGWWVGLIHFSPMLSMPAAKVRVDLAPVWAAWFWPILAYSVVETGLSIVALATPGRVRLRRMVSLALGVAGAAILAAVLQAGHFVEVSGPWSAAQELQANFDRGVRIGLTVTVGFLLLRALTDAWRLWRYPRDSASRMAASPSR